MAKHKNIREALESQLRPGHHILSVGPGPAFIDATPLLALNISGKSGEVVLLDSQTQRNGRFVGSYSPGLEIGHLGLFTKALSDLKRLGAIDKEPRAVLMDVRKLDIPERFDAIIEQNMLAYHRPQERQQIVSAYRKHLKNGGKAIVITHDLGSGKNYKREAEALAELFQKHGFRSSLEEISSARSGIREIERFNVKHSGLDKLRSYDNEWGRRGIKSYMLVAKKRGPRR